ncbi:MAG: hypothetical protein ABL997_05250 [Planctomycetota bacterium]
MHPLPIVARPKASYWWTYVLIAPVAGLMLFAFTLPLIKGVFDCRPTPHECRVAWAVTSAAIAGLMLRFDRTMLYFELTTSCLQLGRGSGAHVIRFSDLDSIVMGLPDRIPTWMRWLGHLPRVRAAVKTFRTMRANAIYLRCRDGRFVPLSLASAWLQNGALLHSTLLELLEQKVVGPDSYTDEETAALERPRWNRVRWLRQLPRRP